MSSPPSTDPLRLLVAKQLVDLRHLQDHKTANMDPLRRQTSAETAQSLTTGVYQDKTVPTALASPAHEPQPITMVPAAPSSPGDVVLELVSCAS